MNLIKERRPKMNRINNNEEKSIYQYDHYLSLDWSQKNMAIGRMKKNSIKPQIMDVKSDIKEAKKYFSGLKGSKILTIEETTSTHWLAVELKESVDRILICDPYRNRLLNQGPKTDKIDAGKLCQLLRANMLHEVYHNLEEDYSIKKLVSAYDDLIKFGVRLQNQRSAIYRAEGLNHKKDNLPEDNATLQFIEQSQNKAIELYNEEKKEYHKYFDKIRRQNKLIGKLECIPGIGTIIAVKIYGVVIDAHRFINKYQYWSYCGLALNQKESGGRSYGKRKPRYSRKLKGAYDSAAMAAIGGNNDIADYYNQLLEKGLSVKQAKQAVARYISKVSYGILKTGENYVPYKWRQTQQDKGSNLK
jgi:transposase